MKERWQFEDYLKQGSDYMGLFLINQMDTISKLYRAFQFKANMIMREFTSIYNFLFQKLFLLFSELREIETCKSWLLIQDR